MVGGANASYLPAKHVFQIWKIAVTCCKPYPQDGALGAEKAHPQAYFLPMPPRAVTAIGRVPYIVQPESAISAAEQKHSTLSGILEISPGMVNCIMDDLLTLVP